MLSVSVLSVLPVLLRWSSWVFNLRCCGYLNVVEVCLVDCSTCDAEVDSLNCFTNVRVFHQCY